MKILGSTLKSVSSGVMLACGLLGQHMLAQTQPYSWSIIAGQTISTNHLPGHVDGTNGKASFYNPWAITADRQGKLSVAESDRIRQLERIGSDWVVTTLPLTNPVGPSGFDFGWVAAGEAGELFATYQAGGPLLQIRGSGMNWAFSQVAPNCTYPFTNVFDCWSPGPMVADNQGNLFVADKRYNTIKKMNFDGANWVVETIAGTPNVYPTSLDGTNEQASFSQIMGITVDKGGNLYVTEYDQNTVRKIAPEGTNWIVTTIAGSAGAPFVEIDGTNQQARFTFPYAIAADSKGAVYVLDQTSPNPPNNGTLRKLTQVGTNWVVRTIAVDNPTLNDPLGLAVDTADNLYIADTGNCTIRLGTPLPSLQAVRTGNQIVISWSASNYVLESTTTLDDSESWVPVTDGVATVGNSLTVTNQLRGSGTFFRLRQQ